AVLPLPRAAAADHGVDVLQLAGAHEHRAFAAERHRARSGEALGPDFDLEALWDFQLVEREFLRGFSRDLDRERVQGGFLLLAVAALLPGGRRGGSGGGRRPRRSAHSRAWRTAGARKKR